MRRHSLVRRQSTAGWLALLLLIGMVGVGCHPGEVDDIDDLNVVATFYSEDAPFGTYMTYAMDDTIYNLNVLDDPSATDDLDRQYDAAIIAQVKSEMESLGYAEVDTGTTEDIRLGLGAFTTNGTLAWMSFPWWGGSPGHWWPSWNTVNYTQGTLQIFMADWRDYDPGTGEVEPIWTASCMGVLQDSSTGTRVSTLISQAYDQSPYLEAGSDGKAVEVAR